LPLIIDSSPCSATFVCAGLPCPGPYSEGGLRGLNHPPRKVYTKMSCMNIIMAVIGLVGLKRAPECIKMHHFEGENAKIFLRRGHSPLPRPHPHWGGGLDPQTTFLDRGLIRAHVSMHCGPLYKFLRWACPCPPPLSRSTKKNIYVYIEYL